MPLSPLEFVRAAPEHTLALASFFQALKEAGDDRFFHPHPFTADEAARVAHHAGLDLYCLAVSRGEVLAYGMLRGCDAGFAVPSLGIAVHPTARGTGLARAFMGYLHAAARAQGAARVRLKVYPDNVRAHRLYQSLGYHFEAEPAEQLVGYCTLERAA